MKRNKVPKEKILSTFEREMKDPQFKKAFEKSYKDFLLSELMIEWKEKHHVLTRKK